MNLVLLSLLLIIIPVAIWIIIYIVYYETKQKEYDMISEISVHAGIPKDKLIGRQIGLLEASVINEHS